MICVIGTILYIKVSYKTISAFIRTERIINTLEYNFIAIGAYEQYQQSKIYILPNISIFPDHLEISLPNIQIRKKIENYIDQISTALPQSLIVSSYYYTAENDKLILEYEDTNNNNRLIFVSPEEIANTIKALKYTELLFDTKHIIDLTDFPHWLISGTTGSGKSYFVQFLLLQCLIKKYEIAVYDYKRSYQFLSDFIEYETEPKKIIKALEYEVQTMHERMSAMDSLLKKNPRALAIDKGYSQRIIVIEEYIGLMSALDSKESKHLESLVKEISVLARSVNISLVIVLQSAGTDSIGSSLRHNLNKILLGNAQSNILTATFGTGVDIPKISRKLQKGEGFIQLTRIEPLLVPTLEYQVSDITWYLSGSVEP